MKLDYFYSVRHIVEKMQSGDRLTIADGCCLNADGQVVVRFSKCFNANIEKMKQKGLPGCQRINKIHSTLEAGRCRR